MENKLNVTLEQISPQLRGGQVDVTIRVSSALNFSAYAARQKAAGILLSRAGTGIGADPPELVIQHERLLWRVPAFLALPGAGRLGKVGSIDIDAQSGEALVDETIISAIVDNARQLAAHPAS
jgi:hypothetical protein